MFRQSISTLLFLTLVVTFILPIIPVVNDAEAAGKHVKKTAKYKEVRTHDGELCEVEFMGTETATVKHPEHEDGLVKLTYVVATAVFPVEKCDDDDDNEDDGGSTTS